MRSIFVSKAFFFVFSVFFLKMSIFFEIKKIKTNFINFLTKHLQSVINYFTIIFLVNFITFLSRDITTTPTSVPEDFTEKNPQSKVRIQYGTIVFLFFLFYKNQVFIKRTQRHSHNGKGLLNLLNLHFCHKLQTKQSNWFLNQRARQKPTLIVLAQKVQR